MSFEEKYSPYRKLGKIEVSEDYVNKTATRISEKISERRGVRVPIAWSLSGVSAAALVLVFGLFVYPKFFGIGGDGSMAATGTDTTQHIAGRNATEKTPLPQDSGELVSLPEKKYDNKSIEGIELDKETIMEYLLDEGYEEI